jgi:hypothetical protein
MVLFVDYDQDTFPSLHHNGGDNMPTVVYRTQLLSDDRTIRSNMILKSPDYTPVMNKKQIDQLENGGTNATPDTSGVRGNPNINSFSAALSCYPYVIFLL